MKALHYTILVIVAIVLTVIGLLRLPCPENKTYGFLDKSDYVVVKNEYDIRQVNFDLPDDEKILYWHSLYPGHQGCRDIGCKYSGKILIDNIKYKIKLKNQITALAVKYKNTTYLLTRDYMHEDYYYWYKFDSRNKLIKLEFSDIPPEFHHIKFKNNETNYSYMTGMLYDAFNIDADMSFNLLKKYILDKDYFVFTYDRPTHYFSGYLRDLKEKYGLNKNKNADLIKVMNDILIKFPNSEAAGNIQNYSLELLR